MAAGLTKGPRTREELALATALPPDRLDGALALASAAGDVERTAAGGGFSLTPRGSVHLEALQARRNEGEVHVETLTEFAVFLQARGIALSVPRQVAGILTPDGQFQWGAHAYNVEVECSTVSKAAAQVVRNVKKGQAAGHRVPIALPERTAFPAAVEVLEAAFPGIRLWRDGVGVVWKEGRATFRPHRVPGTGVWPFLEPAPLAEDPEREEEDEESYEPPYEAPFVGDTDPLISWVRDAVRDMVADGMVRATTSEILRWVPSDARRQCSEQRVGRALSLLGAKSRRILGRRGEAPSL